MPSNSNLKMQPDELLDLHAQVEDVALRDHQVGRVLHAMLHHMAHAHNLDVADEQEKARKQAEEDEAARLKATQEEEARVEAERVAQAKRAEQATEKTEKETK